MLPAPAVVGRARDATAAETPGFSITYYFPAPSLPSPPSPLRPPSPCRRSPLRSKFPVAPVRKRCGSQPRRRLRSPSHRTRRVPHCRWKAVRNDGTVSDQFRCWIIRRYKGWQLRMELRPPSATKPIEGSPIEGYGGSRTTNAFSWRSCGDTDMGGGVQDPVCLLDDAVDPERHRHQFRPPAGAP